MIDGPGFVRTDSGIRKLRSLRLARTIESCARYTVDISDSATSDHQVVDLWSLSDTLQVSSVCRGFLIISITVPRSPGRHKSSNSRRRAHHGNGVSGVSSAWRMRVLHAGCHLFRVIKHRATATIGTMRSSPDHWSLIGNGWHAEAWHSFMHVDVRRISVILQPRILYEYDLGRVPILRWNTVS